MFLVPENEKRNKFQSFLPKTTQEKQPQKYFFPIRKCIFGFQLLTTGPSQYPKCTLCSGTENGHFCQKCQSLRPKKWHFEWPNQNSKTTFIVQTFPKYGPYDFYLVNLSLLGAILAIFQFCGFSGLFWPFFPCKQGRTQKSFPKRQFLVRFWPYFKGPTENG